MKFSQFNTIIPHEDSFALYNSLNQQVLFILPDLKMLLDASLNEGVESLGIYHPTFYNYLVNQNFIVDSSIDEVQLVKELSETVDNNTNSFLLTINPTMNCNFKCWYCYETHIKSSKIDELTFTKINKFISNTAAKGDITEFSLSFFGGEPLLYFKQNVIPIIDHYLEECSNHNKSSSISFTSNGYLINDDFLDYFKSKNKTCSLQITLDGYKSKHDQVRFVSANKGSYEKIISNIKMLILNKFFVRLRVNYTNSNIEDTYLIASEFNDISKEIKDNYLMFDFHKVWQETEEESTAILLYRNVERINETGITATSNLSPNNVINSCYADKKNSVVINYNGEIYKCTARDFKSENREGYIDDSGELIWENGSLEKRMSAKFKNKPCLTCKILPLCNGGCSQHALEYEGTDYCVYNGDENEKNRIVKNKIEEILHNKKKVDIPNLVEVVNEE